MTRKPIASRNEELFRCGLDAWHRRDFDAALAFFTPDVEWDGSRVFLDQSPLHGREALRAYWEDAVARWQDFRFAVEDVVDAGDVLVAAMRLHGRGAESGVEIEQPLAYVYEFRGDLAWRVRLFPTMDEALAAAGVER